MWLTFTHALEEKYGMFLFFNDCYFNAAVFRLEEDFVQRMCHIKNLAFDRRSRCKVFNT